MLLLEGDFFDGEGEVVGIGDDLVPGVVVEDFGGIGEVAGAKDGGTLDDGVAAILGGRRRRCCGGCESKGSRGGGWRGERDVFGGHGRGTEKFEIGDCRSGIKSSGWANCKHLCPVNRDETFSKFQRKSRILSHVSFILTGSVSNDFTNTSVSLLYLSK